MNHFIIPCGTSQLEKATILGFSPYYTPENESMIKKNYSTILKTCVESLTQFWPNRDQFIGNSLKKPFGAELSTLIQLQQYLYPGEDGWGEGDTFVLFASDTEKGRLAATILYHVLLKWDVDDRSIFKNEDGNPWFIIEGLKDQSTSTEMENAMITLVDLVFGHCVPPVTHKKKWVPAKAHYLVMTGGYKSIIPCLTLMSLLYQFNLVYLFEQSDELQFLQPQIQYKDGSRDMLRMVFKKPKNEKKPNIGGWFERVVEGFIEDER